MVTIQPSKRRLLGLPRAVAAMIAALAACALVPTGAAARGPDPVTAAKLGADAFIYGYPLAEFLRVRAEATSVACPDIYGNAPVNTLSNTGGFARPQDRIVVAPNVDTLYTISHLDLGDGPVVLSHPDMGNRYFVFQFLDPYTNTLGYVGSRTTGSAAGRFALTWKDGPKVDVPGAETIELPYRKIWMIGRTLAGDAADQVIAHQLVDQYSLTPTGGAPQFAADCTPGSPVRQKQLTGIALLDAISAAMEESPPPARDARQLAKMAKIGVGPGRRVADAGLGRVALHMLDRSVRATQQALPSLVLAKQYLGALKTRGWSIPQSNIGDYGTDYLFRAGVAQIGLGANTPEEAAYAAAFLDGNRLPLNGRHTYRMTFRAGQQPPAGAFWSVTVYDREGYLPYGIDTHAIGSHRPGLVQKPDGSTVIVFSQTKPTEPDVNWLQVPPAQFRAYLRVYAPDASVLSGAWRPPAIDRVR